MKTIQIESTAEINVKGKKGIVRVIFEIPYPETIFVNPSEENKEWLEEANKVLQKTGAKTNQGEEVFINISQQVYSPVAKQIVNYLAATLTTGISSMEILSLLQLHLEQARKEAIEIVERNTKEAKKWS